MTNQPSTNPLANLKNIFHNRPEVLKMLDIRELDLESLESDAYIKKQKEKNLYPEPVNFYATGRTGAGKTSLGNALLGSGKVEKPPMKSTGHQDCTDFVGYFTLASNLKYFDLPGAGSNENYENINRVALLLEQIEDEFAEPEIKPIEEFEFHNFSDYQTAGIRKEVITVQEWQSAEYQKVCSADVILYVVAPHQQFTRDDGNYLIDLLKQHKQRHEKDPRIIFALNIHRTKTGEIIPTPQNIEDCKKIIAKIYQKFYPDSLLPIVEIDSRTGKGINQITELICRILPPEKIGNMQQVLKDELKQFAQKERSRRYRQALIYIASRLAITPVDTPLGKGILNEAYGAVCNYGISVFMEEDARLEMDKAFSDWVDEVAAKTKKSRTEAIEVLTETIDGYRTEETEEPDGEEAEYEDVTITEEILDVQPETQQVRRSTAARAGLGVLEGATIPFTGIISAGQWLFTGGKVKDEDLVVNKVHESFDRDSYRNENVLVSKTREVTRTERKFKGMKEKKKKVIKQIPNLVEKMEKVGEKFIQGGYPAVENLLAIGLGIETASKNSSIDLSQNFEQILASGQRQVKTLLGRYEEQVNQLAESNDPDSAEAQIIKILEGAFLS